MARQGKCINSDCPYHGAWGWDKDLPLSRARCPECNESLHQTAYLHKGPWRGAMVVTEKDVGPTLASYPPDSINSIRTVPLMSYQTAMDKMRSNGKGRSGSSLKELEFLVAYFGSDRVNGWLREAVANIEGAGAPALVTAPADDKPCETSA